MTAIETRLDGARRTVSAFDAPFEQIEFDLYRDVHKGIRAELFAVTALAGETDPRNEREVDVLVARLVGFLDLLDDHAEHEESILGPFIAQALPSLAERVESEHRIVEATMLGLRRHASALAAATSVDRRAALHRLYEESAEFVSDYLAHLSTEDVEIMPALAAVVGVDELLAVNAAIIAAVPPEQMDVYLGLMVPAMNPVDRTEMLDGMRADAPPEVFAHTVDVARAALSDDAFALLGVDLGIGGR